MSGKQVSLLYLIPGTNSAHKQSFPHQLFFCFLTLEVNKTKNAPCHTKNPQSPSS